MRYWTTLDSIQSKTVRISADLISAMRVFCYTFVISLLIKGVGPIALGYIQLTESFIKITSLPVALFILVDIARPLIYLIGLHIVQGIRWLKYKNYRGNENEEYDPKMDSTELIFEPHTFEIVLMNHIPTTLLLLKIFFISWLICVFILQLAFNLWK